MTSYPYLTNARGHTMRADQLIERLFPGKNYKVTVPPNVGTEDWVELDGVKVQYLTSEAAKDYWSDRRGRSVGMGMRAVAMCPHCSRVVAASRINQHARVHNSGLRKGY